MENQNYFYALTDCQKNFANGLLSDGLVAGIKRLLDLMRGANQQIRVNLPILKTYPPLPPIKWHDPQDGACYICSTAPG